MFRKAILFTITVLAALQASAVDVTPQQKTNVISRIISELKDKYPFPNLSARMESTLNSNLTSGAYSTLNDGEAFAGRLTKDLQDISKDRHIFVNYVGEPQQVQPIHHIDSIYAPSEAILEIERNARQENYGTSEVRILNGNVGYIRFDMLWPLEFAAPVYAAGMRYIANTDALIIDLRYCGGAQSPDVIPFLAGYLFEHPTHLTNFYLGGKGKPQQLWSVAAVEGPKYLNKPVYVLTSKTTFSGGEAFAYELQAHKRATVVGEVTGGGGNPNAVFPVEEHFVFSTPFATVENPVTGTSWNEKGVQPDVVASRIEAQYRAHLLALEQLLAKAGDDRKKMYADVIEDVKADSPAVTEVRFELPGYEAAKSVSVIGTFNSYTGWANPMEKVGGKWTGTVSVLPGRHHYLFLVDGQPVLDPANKSVSADKRTNLISVKTGN